jgi:hypothetical protein
LPKTFGLAEPDIQPLDLSRIRLRRHAPALRPDRKSSEGRQRLQSRLNVPQIDFGLEKRDLIIERDLVDIDVPGPGSAVAASRKKRRGLKRKPDPS